MAIKIQGSTIIDDSRNINSAGITTVTSVSIGNTQVISSSRQLQNITSINATTTSPFVVTDIGSVGIGTTNPTSKLTVGGDGNFTGVVTASSFSGNASSATYATNAGISTNLKGGLAGNIPYQSGPDTTVFLANGTSGFVLQSNGVGNAPSWVAAAPVASITGLTIQEENEPVGTENAVNTLNFRGSNITATASGGISTITVSDNLVGTALSISGISTISVNSSSNALRITQTGTGNALVVEDETNPDASPFVVTGTGSVGIGITNPSSTLDVRATGATIRVQNPAASNYSVLLDANTGGPRISLGQNGDNVFVDFGAYSGTNNLDTKERDLRLFSTAAPNAFRLKQDTGNIGINSTSPTQKLDVVGNIKLTGELHGPSNFIIDPTTVGDNTGLVRIKGDLYVDGTQFVVNSTTIELADFNVGIATTVGTNLLLDGAGIGIGSTNIRKTITWNNTAGALTSSEDWNLVSGKQYEINGTSVLTSTTLGSGVVNSSLTSVGTLGQLNVSGISTLGVTSTTNLTTQQLNVSGVTTVGFITATNIWNAGITTSSRLTLNGSNSTADGGGQIYLNGATGNRIDFNTNGSAAPAFTTRSAGTKIVLYPQVGASAVDFGFGIEANTVLWSSIPQANSVYAHRWYGGTTQLADLKGSGEFLLGSTSIVSSAKLQVTGGAYISGSVGIGTTNPTSTLQVAGTFYNSGIGTFANGNNTFGTSSASSLELGLNNTNNAGTLKIWGTTSNAYGIIQVTTTNLHIDTVVGGTYLNYYDGDFISFGTGAGAESARFTGSTGTLTLGSITPTGTASQRLQVTGGAYVSDNLGVGNTNPGAKLDVTGDIRLSAADPEIEFNSGGPRLKVPEANTLTIHTGGGLNSTTNEAVRINTTGVGIGTTNPASKLHIYNGNLTIENTAPGSLDGPYIDFKETGFNDRFGVFADFGGIGDDNKLHLTANSSGAVPQTSDAKVTLLPSGAFLIGSVSPTGTASQRLQVTGGAYVSGDVGIGITNPSHKLELQGTRAWFKPNSDGSDAVALSLGRYSDSNQPFYDILTDDATGDNVTHRINRYTGNWYFRRASPTGYQTGLLVASSFATGTSVSIGNSIGNTQVYLYTNGNSYFNNDGAVLVGSATSTGTASQKLQVTGGAYVSGNLGVGITNPQSTLHLQSAAPTLRFTETDAAANHQQWMMVANNQELYWQAQTDAYSGGGNLFKMTRSNEQIQTFEGQNSGVTWFTINNNTQRVGIGTTNPLSPLEVAQDTTGVHDLTITNLNTGNNITKASRIRFRLTDSVGTKKDVAYITAYTYNLDSSAGNYLSFFTRTLDSNPTEKMRLDNNGNLVLGSSFTATGTSSQPLQVNGGAYVSGNLGVGNTNGEGIKLFVSQGAPAANRPVALITDDGTIPTMTGGATLRISNDGSINSFALLEAESSVGRLVFTNAGNLGIGITNPTSKLTVGGDGNFTGVVTASSFSGNASSATYATNAGLSTNLKGGLAGNLVYQSATDTTAFLANGASGFVLQSNGVGNAPSWVAAAPVSSITGLTIQEEGSQVGTANAVNTLNFIGSNITATASGGISTITVSDNLVGTALSISGISTLGITTFTGAVSFGTSAYFGANDKIIFGDAQRLQIYHNNSDAYISNSNLGGELFIESNNIYLRPNTGLIIVDRASAHNRAIFATGVDLYYNNVLRFETTGYGVTVYGGLQVSGIVTASQFTTGSGNLGFTTNTISGPSEIIIDPSPVGVGTTSGIVRVRGDLYVDGTQFIVNSTTIELADFNVGIATTVGTNLLLDGAGIGIGSTNIRKSITWNNTAGALTSSEDWNIASGKIYEIGGTSVLSSTTLGSGVVNSSLTSVGTLGQLNVSGITTTNNLNVTGVGTFLSSGLKIRNPANTFQYNITGDAIVADRTLNLPVITGTDTLAVLGINQTFTGAQTFGGILSATSTLSLTGSATGIHRFGTQQTSASITLGGSSGTGLITLGQATTSQQTDIQAGASGVGTTKTINLGTGGLSGSFTQINIGPTAGVGTVVINTGTNLGIGTTNPTSRLTVSGDARVSGVVTAMTFSGQINAGVSTLGVTTTTNLTTQQLSVSGLSTFSNNINVASGIITTTGSGGVGIGSFLRLKPYLTEGGEIGFDYTNGSLGYYLDVSGGNVFRFSNYDTNGTYTFTTNSTEKVRISNAGNLGIGTNNPTVALQLSPNASISNVGSATTLAGTVGSALTVAQFYHSNTNASYIRIKAARNATGSDWTTASTKLVNVTDVTEQGYIEYNPSGSTYGMAFGSGATEWARFLQNGNLGIGVTNPSQKFEVSGTSRFFTSGQGDVTITHSNLVSTIRGASTVQLALGANNSEAIRINTSGSVGIGTTNPTSTLHVIGDTLVIGAVTATNYDTTSTRNGSATATTTATSQTVIHTISRNQYRSVEYLVQAVEGTNFHTTKILVVHDGTNAYLTEYGTVYNNATVASYDVDISGANIRLLATPASSSSTTFKISFTTIVV